MMSEVKDWDLFFFCGQQWQLCSQQIDEFIDTGENDFSIIQNKGEHRIYDSITLFSMLVLK